MATTLTDSFIKHINVGSMVDYNCPTSATTTETFSFALNNSNDDIFLVIDASNATPGDYSFRLEKGNYPNAKTPSATTFSDGYVLFVPIESGMIEKKDGCALFTLTTNVSNGLCSTGLKIGVIKKKFVTNN